MENKFGKVSRLCLTASRKGEKTILSDLSFTAPFKVMRPFYEKKDRMSVMLLTASAGIMAGDRQEMELTLERGANMEFLSQAYDKIHRMETGYAERKTRISIGKEAILYYTPLPVIPFAGSDYRSELQVSLEDETSRFVYTDVLTCGRIAYGEEFAYRKFLNTVTVTCGDTLIYRDRSCYEPEKTDMTGFGMYEGFTHLATMLLCNIPVSDQWLTEVRARLEQMPEFQGGVTRTASGDVVLRILGRNADRLVAFLEELKKELVLCWRFTGVKC
ncbi:MAG: urease accessory protein UreD [Lachnospiraceae bacterium]|nr:urease accessory protein UreD [Lachnospiraceae bacterium]